jgi:hypothetical protein
VAVARGFKLRIATALSDTVVCISSISSSSSVGGLRVRAGVYERHLLHDERGGIMGGNERAMLRAEARGIKRRNRWRVDIASFRRHLLRGKKKN